VNISVTKAPVSGPVVGARKALPVVQVTDRPQVVIVGAGFGGLNAALALRAEEADVTVIDRRNYHLFQPLLYQVATAALSPADIATPIRAIFRNQKNASALMAQVTGVDLNTKEVLTEDRRIPFDYLIIATGARDAYFGHDEWEKFAPGLKKIDDATDIRRRILLAFETAEASSTGDRAGNLTLAVIGGGPTGVEMAGAMAELVRGGLARDFRRIDPLATRVLVIEAGPRLLASFPPALSAKAERQLRGLGVEVRTNAPVSRCDADGIVIAGKERIWCDCLVWAAGIAASPAAKWLAAEKDKSGRVFVTPTLNLPGRPDVFVIGDTAHVVDESGKPVPGVAPAAKQMGRYVGRVIGRRLRGKAAPSPFEYRDYGNLATIGRKAAVADFGWLHLSGFPAWILWGLAHIYFLIGFRNRTMVMLGWLWSYVTFDRGARLITGGH
jgi:NADH dehydrogenase